MTVLGTYGTATITTFSAGCGKAWFLRANISRPSTADVTPADMRATRSLGRESTNSRESQP